MNLYTQKKLSKGGQYILYDYMYMKSYQVRKWYKNHRQYILDNKYNFKARKMGQNKQNNLFI